MNEIAPKRALFIKLGTKGLWEKDCIELNQTLRLGFNEFTHEDCLADKWDMIRDYYIQQEKRNPKKAGNYVREIQDFYTSSEDVLWITFYQQMLWWCFADSQVTGSGNDLKIRKVKGKWQNTTIQGVTLHVDDLSGRLLKKQMYRGTICNIDCLDYLVRTINGQELECVTTAKQSLAMLKKSVEGLLRELHQNDFELFADLLFRASGYQRTGVVGKTQKTKDIELLARLADERILVQVKSSSTLAEYRGYEQDFEGLQGYHKFFYVVHSPDSHLSSYVPSNPKIVIWKADKLAELAVNAGLTEWLIRKI